MAMDIFLKLDGIDGESKDAAHTNEIHVNSWSWGMVQSGTTHKDAGGGGGKVTGGDLSMSKDTDNSTPALMKHCCNGNPIATGTLTCRESGGDAPVEYLKIEFEEIIVTSYQANGDADGLDRIGEHLTLNFRKYVTTYTKQNEDGSAGASTPQGWDFAQNTAAS